MVSCRVPNGDRVFRPTTFWSRKLRANLHTHPHARTSHPGRAFPLASPPTPSTQPQPLHDPSAPKTRRKSDVPAARRRWPRRRAQTAAATAAPRRWAADRTASSPWSGESPPLPPGAGAHTSRVRTTWYLLVVAAVHNNQTTTTMTGVCVCVERGNDRNAGRSPLTRRPATSVWTAERYWVTRIPRGAREEFGSRFSVRTVVGAFSGQSSASACGRSNGRACVTPFTGRKNGGAVL